MTRRIGFDFGRMRRAMATVALCAWAGIALAAGAYQQTGHFGNELHDSDGDGVADIDDNCPGTPREVSTPRGDVPTPVDGCGCPLDPCKQDSDHDGVPDCVDDCPGTYRGLGVKEDGCPAPLTHSVRVHLDVKFAFDKATIEPGFAQSLLQLRDALLRFPEIRVKLEGHTDNKGSDEYNQKLSEARANAARDFILKDGGIDPDRVEAAGYGRSRPIASNDTEEGQALNRRTVAEVVFDKTIVPANDQPPPLEGLAPEQPAPAAAPAPMTPGAAASAPAPPGAAASAVPAPAAPLPPQAPESPPQATPAPPASAPDHQ